MISVDLEKAYYQVDLPEDLRVFIRIPRYLKRAGLWRCKKVIPGLREGAKLFNDEADQRFREGLKTELVTAGWYRGKHGSREILRFMDDLTCAMEEETVDDYLDD